MCKDTLASSAGPKYLLGKLHYHLLGVRGGIVQCQHSSQHSIRQPTKKTALWWLVHFITYASQLE
jgi:hypothetical protein